MMVTQSKSPEMVQNSGYHQQSWTFNYRYSSLPDYISLADWFCLQKEKYFFFIPVKNISVSLIFIYKKRGYAKGARSIYMGLLHMKPPVIMNIKKIRRLMKKFNLFCPIRKANPYRRMAKAIKTNNYADNLLQRQFECYGPRYVLLTDITYIPYNGTFAYLSTILDAFTKQILAYVLSASLEIEFVKETVEILVRDHGISLHKETLIHSDYAEFRIIQIREAIIQALHSLRLLRIPNFAGPCPAAETAGITHHRRVSLAILKIISASK